MSRKLQITECPYCNGKVVWINNRKVYGKEYGKSHMMYICESCGASVGCHKNTRRPLGTLANKELRGLRHKCHDKIDPYWMAHNISRDNLYKLLSEWYGSEFHIGQLREDGCKRVLEELDVLKLLKDKNGKHI